VTQVNIQLKHPTQGCMSCSSPSNTITMHGGGMQNRDQFMESAMQELYCALCWLFERKLLV
jgi:hypothetical protein